MTENHSKHLEEQQSAITGSVVNFSSEVSNFTSKMSAIELDSDLFSKQVCDVVEGALSGLSESVKDKGTELNANIGEFQSELTKLSKSFSEINMTKILEAQAKGLFRPLSEAAETGKDKITDATELFVTFQKTIAKSLAEYERGVKKQIKAMEKNTKALTTINRQRYYFLKKLLLWFGIK